MVKLIDMSGAAIVAGCLFVLAAPAQALTAQECSAKYQAAKTSGTLNGQKWADFRKAECGDGAAAAATPPGAQTAAARPASPSAATATAAAATFPKAVDPKYAKEKESKARMKTCVDQYNANKSANANGGMKWIQKGGGYYSECNKRLKGAA